MNIYSSYTDEQLVGLLKTGDESAFSEIYDRYWELLFGLAHNRLKQLHEAEDTVHDVFASLWKVRSTQDISSLRSYIAVSLKYNVLRIAYRKKLFTAFVTDGSREQPGHSTPPDGEEEIMFRIRNEIDKLPEKCRIIFKMSRIDGMSNAEIAQTLQITSKTVENQINKAQVRLRHSLKDLAPVLVFLFLHR